jgi:hypothetical protein
MVGNFKENAMSTTTSNSKASATKSKGPLALRLGLYVVAALVLIIGIIAACNAIALNTYNQATQSLVSNIKTAKKDTADLAMLKSSQEQTDSQFADAQALSAILLPTTNNTIKHNAETSRKLTALITSALKAQQSSTTSSDSNQAETDKKSTSSSTSGLSQEEREKVQELLKQNQATQTPTPSASSSSSNTSTSENVKPW